MSQPGMIIAGSMEHQLLEPLYLHMAAQLVGLVLVGAGVQE
jgi:hypothetical protein